MRNLLLAVVAAAAAATAQAQPESAYYGLSLGSFDYEEEDGFADTTDSWRLMVGYQFLEHLGVEGGYGKAGTLADTQTFLLPAGPTTIDFRSEFTILTVRLLGVLPFDNGVKLLAGLGYADVEQKFSIRSDQFGEGSGKSTGNEPAYYAGAQYDWDRVAVRLAYEKYDFGGGIDVAESSITFFYKL